MKKKLNMLTVLVFMTVIGSTAAIAGIFVTVPTIPRTRISNNRPDSNPLKDSVRVGCELMDSIWTFKANAVISGTCPGFNVRNKIRWDWANTKMSSVMSNDQTDGDGRALFRRIIVTGCNSPNGVYSDTVVVRTSCQTPGGDTFASFVNDVSTNKTQAECEAVGWSFTSSGPNSGTCQPNESSCVEAGGVWSFSTSTCGPTQSDCVGEGGSWDSFNSTCSGLPGPSPEPTPTPVPTPTPTPPPSGGGSCSAWWVIWCTDVDYSSCTCVGIIDKSPILIDVLGNGFALTDAQHGVIFDLDTNGVKEQLSWTASGSDDAFLVLDRNNNGTIDDGSELFGNFTPQPEPLAGKQKNGFLALAEYDTLAHGGNGDGLITQADAVFGSLRLWHDIDHNGVSHANELMPLSSANVATLELRYRTSTYLDQYGNKFRYRAKVKDVHGAQVGRWMWDVFLRENR